MPNDFIFKPEDHSYWLGDRPLPSVTQVLSRIPGRYQAEPYYLERGKFVHKATQLYDQDELDWDTVDPVIKPYVDAYVKFRTDTGFEPHYIEHRLYHPSYFYAGTIDRIGPMSIVPAVLDLKTGVKVRADELQIAAYWELCRINDIPIKKSFLLYLTDNATYKLEPVESPRKLLPVFMAHLTIMRWEEEI